MVGEHGNAGIDESSPVSWRAILAGSTASIAVALLLYAFGVGMGFSIVSPWTDTGVSATTFTIAGGLYLIVVAMLSSTIGGYIAGRLRSQWVSVHSHERYFRDTAHGFLVWAFAMFVSAAVLGGATTHIISAASGGFGAAATSVARTSPTDVYVDNLLRAQASPAPGQAMPSGNSDMNATRGELTRILAPSLRKYGNLADTDKSYLVQVVSTRTGLSQADAQQRVDQVTAQAKADADAARKSAARFSFWLVISMLAGALSASLAAVEGGSLRNSEWYLTAK